MLTEKPYCSLVSLLVSLLLLSACTKIDPKGSITRSALYDEGFSHFSEIKVEDEYEIFHLDEDAKQFVKQAISQTTEPMEQVRVLIETIFSDSKFNLLYSANANTVANETFRNKAANCLSLSIMTYALAEEAGFEVKFQDIAIPEYWTRRAGYSLLNRHINLRLLTEPKANAYNLQVQGYQVDFDPQSASKYFAKQVVGKHTIVAMYYNNKGADALVDNRLDEAYAYFRQATKVDPYFASSLVNLGILYRKKAYYDKAEIAYNKALELDPQSLTALENLGYLYQFTGRVKAASEVLYKVERRRANNPYYHINLGEEEWEHGNYKLALAHYKKALSLDKKKHEIYFGLARVYYMLGELTLTEHYLQLAKDLSNNAQDERRYQSKLDFLTSI